MGVYIKGMEMPKACNDCFCWNCRYDNMGYQPIPEECPLTTVPQHGRLIDADELLQSHSVSDGIYFPDAYIPATAIKAAPTIIPAEEADCHTSDTVTGSR